MEKGLPTDWREKIKDKKVVFYNTSVSSMLNGGEQHIAKIEHVLDTCRAQDEVVLWWRPHPLELSTLQSMRPDLEQKYRKIREQYETEGWGILDTSADVHRAIAVSDAYYGDWSSVIHLYKATGKPVLISNDAVIKTLPLLIFPKATLLKNDCLWCVQINSNKLLKIEKDKLKIEKIINIPYEPVYKQRNYNYHIVDYGNKLIILLGESEYLHIYNIKTEELESCKIFNNKKKFTSELILQKEDELFLFPYNDKEIQVYSIKEKKIKIEIVFPQNVRLSKNYEQVKDDIYAVNYESNDIYKINLKDKRYVIRKIGNSQNKYWGIKKAGGFFILLHTDKKVITLWNEETDEIIELKDFPINYDCLQGNAYLSMYSHNNCVYIIPFYGNMILKIDPLKKLILQCFQEITPGKNFSKSTEKFQGEFFCDVIKVGDYIYAFEPYQKMWYGFNLNNCEMLKSSLMIITEVENKEKLKQIIECNKESIRKDNLFTGEDYFVCTLNNYIENIKKYFDKYEKKIVESRIGEIVYKYIMKN